jgi:HSP20 family protein
MLTTLPNRVSALFADPFQTVFRDFERDFPWNGNGPSDVARKVAPLSMWSDGNAVYIDMDVPGIALADLDVSVENGKLTIRGQRKAAEQAHECLHEERFFGQFERTVALSEWVDPSSIEATLRDGVLHVKLSKKPEAQRQKIAISYCADSDAKRIETSK